MRNLLDKTKIDFKKWLKRKEMLETETGIKDAYSKLHDVKEF